MRDSAALSYSTDDTSAFDASPPRWDNSSDKDLQRAKGFCRIVLGSSEKGTRIMDVYQESPIRVLFPKRPDVAGEEAVLVNTSGGVAGGDRLETDVTATGNASIAITTQAAEKVYRCLDESAHIFTTLTLSDAARVAWLPQETILFNRARILRETNIDISSSAELLALEWLVLGRTAHGETLSAGTITDRWRIVKEGKLVWADTFHVNDDTFPHGARKSLMSDCVAIATMVYVGPEPYARLESLRRLSFSHDGYSAATLVAGVNVMRFATRTSYDLRNVLRHVLEHFAQDCGPGPFRVPKMWSC